MRIAVHGYMHLMGSLIAALALTVNCFCQEVAKKKAEDELKAQVKLAEGRLKAIGLVLGFPIRRDLHALHVASSCGVLIGCVMH